METNPVDAVPFIIEEWENTSTIDGKEICLTALGHTKDLKLVESDVLPMLFEAPSNSSRAKVVPPGDMQFLATSLADNPTTRLLQWNWMKTHWSGLETKIGKNSRLLDRIVGAALQTLTDVSALAEIERFFKDKDITAFARALEVSKDIIGGRARYLQRDHEKLKGWLTANGYV